MAHYVTAQDTIDLLENNIITATYFVIYCLVEHGTILQ